LTNRRIIFAILVDNINLIVITFIEPVLSLRLEYWGVSTAVTPLFFAIPTVCYVAMAPFMHLITRKFEDMTILHIGLLIIGFSFLLIGPSYMLNFTNSLWVLTLGLIILGGSYAFTVIPVMPEMIGATNNAYAGKESELNDRLSSIFHTCVGTGQILGPLSGSSVTKYFGFRTGCDIIAIWMITFLLVYFVCCDGVGAAKLSVARLRGLLPNRDASQGGDDEKKNNLINPEESFLTDTLSTSNNTAFDTKVN
jgi:MFS family permease